MKNEKSSHQELKKDKKLVYPKLDSGKLASIMHSIELNLTNDITFASNLRKLGINTSKLSYILGYCVEAGFNKAIKNPKLYKIN